MALLRQLERLAQEIAAATGRAASDWQQSSDTCRSPRNSPELFLHRQDF